MKNTVTLSGCLFAMFALILSCKEDDVQIREISPAKQIHYNFETGDKLGETTFTYDSKGRVTLEYYSDLASPLNDREMRSDYDADGNLTRTMLRNPGVSDQYYVTSYTYENGLKKSEASFHEGGPLGYKSVYYYSGNTPDSVALYHYLSSEERYKHLFTTLFEYDKSGRVTKAYGKDGRGATVYRYQADKLAEVCDVKTSQLTEEVEYCTKHEYNTEGKLIRISLATPWSNEIQEEMFYKDNLLIEKKIYSYPAYEPGNTVDIKLIKYEYK